MCFRMTKYMIHKQIDFFFQLLASGTMAWLYFMYMQHFHS